jgi:hypothetical protein
MTNPQTFSEKMLISYKNMEGRIVFVDNQYFTFTPNGSSALLLVYRQDWNTVTVL